MHGGEWSERQKINKVLINALTGQLGTRIHMPVTVLGFIYIEKGDLESWNRGIPRGGQPEPGRRKSPLESCCCSAGER